MRTIITHRSKSAEKAMWTTMMNNINTSNIFNDTHIRRSEVFTSRTMLACQTSVVFKIMTRGSEENIVILCGVPETSIEVGNAFLRSDTDKVTWMLQYIQQRHFTRRKTGDWRICRIDTEKYKNGGRDMKIIFDGDKDCSEFLEGIEVLKEAGQSWSNVVVKEDRAGTRGERINQIRRQDSTTNENRNIRIIDGQLILDKSKIDDSFIR